MYTYHFCAISDADFDSVKHLDGIIKREALVTTWEEYEELKKDIAKKFSIKNGIITIQYLTLLHQDDSSIDTDKEKQADKVLKKFKLSYNGKEDI